MEAKKINKNLLSEEKLCIMIREILNEEDLKEIGFLKKVKRKISGQIVLREEMFKWLDKAISMRKKVLVSSLNEYITEIKQIMMRQINYE